MAKKILITGAGGFVGGFIVEAALQHGYETWAAVRASTSLEYLTDERINIIELDFSNPETLKEKLYISKDVAKAIETSENKIAINFGTELHIISKNGILLKKYISKQEINDIVMTEGLIGIVYKDKIQIINL
jgi:nucleoside-diphosphate-sugar epimerase